VLRGLQLSAAFPGQEIGKWGKVIREAGLRAD
jgi:hypothetical protein